MWLGYCVIPMSSRAERVSAIRSAAGLAIGYPFADRWSAR
jgi:hypothetical protein